MRRATFIILALFAASGALQADGIAWHEGDVQEAFDLAREQDKPLFLYWGAVWCPPCNQVKATIFSKRAFAEKTKLFVPVYLDGDTEQAQVWGEKLKAWGYPTILVMSPEGEELMRLQMDLQLEEFLEVLDRAVGQMTPMREVLDSALAAMEPRSVPDDSYRRLAFHSWGQDRELDMDAAEQEQAFRILADGAPSHLAEERSRLYMLWLESALTLSQADAEDGAKPYRLSGARRKEADRRLREILDTPRLAIANLSVLSYYADSLIPLVHRKDGRARRKLIDSWLAAMERVRQDDRLSIDERLSTWMADLGIHELQNGPDVEIPEELRRQVTEMVSWADKAAQDHYNRQSVMSTAGFLLRQTGQTEEARQLYLAETEKSETPYYFMSSLAGIARRAGDNDEAVNWMAKAYESSTGRATRFQWGTSYLIGLMDLAPDDTEKIKAESLRVFGELMQLDDAFAGRNHARIGRLSSSYEEWNAEAAHADDLAGLTAELLPGCERFSDAAAEGEDDSLQDRCSSFFSDLGH